MNKVFIVTEIAPYRDGDIILRVFSNYNDAVAYGSELYDQGLVHEYDVHEREVYA